MLWTHRPIIINIVNDLRRNLNNNILIFRVELIEGILLVEDRHSGWRLGLAIITLLLVILVPGDGLTSVSPTLPIHVDLILLNVVGVIGLPLGLGLSQVLLSSRLAIFFSLDLLLPIFLLLALEDLAACNVKLTPSDRRLQPLE